MSLWKIAWRSMQFRALSSSLTALSMTLGVALVVAVLLVHGVVRETFTRGAVGFNLLVGSPKGGKLQLVLNTIYHLDAPAGKLPYRYYQEFSSGKYASAVAQAVPYCLGDNYLGYRVVGTIPALFDHRPGDPSQPYAFSAGRNFAPDAFFESVVGAEVARRTGLKVGSEFTATHGVVDDDIGAEHKHDAFKVVGILAPTGTPNDRALFVNMEGFYLMEGHAKPSEPGDHADTHSESDKVDHAHDEAAHEHDDEHPQEDHAHEEHSESKDAHGEHAHDEHAHEEGAEHEHDHARQPLPDDQKEITAILIRTHSDIQGMALAGQLRDDPLVQTVLPTRVVYDLFDGIVGPLRSLMLVLTGLIVVVAAIGVMVSIYNTMSERRREIAVMRALGAERSTVMAIVLVESLLLSLAGGLIGWALGHAMIAALSPLIEARTGVAIGLFDYQIEELVILPALIVLAVLAGLIPGWAAYRTDVAKSLSAGG